MPHLTLEYTKNLRGFDAGAILLALNRAMAASGQFGESDIKARAVEHEHFAVGVSETQKPFVHVTVALLAGRSMEIRKALSKSLLDALKQVLPTQKGTQATVEIREMDRDTYVKEVL